MPIQNEWISTFFSSVDITEGMKPVKLRKTLVCNQKIHIKIKLS